ncbi:DUF6468 domain-containing protein [Sphingosinithalassobacter sp. CS137]|uniref:DUF6468 domain-containing protein n=1 Tax=Sphingosinithalassobacter sp. CS137 TaxID=2762748 RepID=UPI00165D3D4F|nr:DUF6468 domain-containing protein [Sphingosinithalassobacter sp. CS137]
MSIAVTTNLLTMALCLAVLVQSVRMMRSLRRVKDGALTEVVAALEKATGEARTVLSDMKSTLGRECADNARLVAEARGLRDELSVMIGIADATAERIVEAVGTANAARSEAESAEDAADEDESEATVASIAPVVAEAA